MTNNVSVFGGSVAMTDSKALLASMVNTAADDPRAGDKQYLNFSGKRGLFAAGANKDNIQPDVKLAVNVSSFQNGWLCWKGGKPVEKLFVSASEPTPSCPPDGQHGPFDRAEDGWMQAKMFMLKDIDSLTEYEFSTNSASGCNAVAGLATEIRNRLVDDEPCWPVIHLEAEEFTAQGYKNFKPVFVIEDWKTAEELGSMLASEEVADDEADEVADDMPVAEPVDKPVTRRRSI
jgi:hypothetical protein